MTDPVTVIVAAAIGGFASAVVSNIRHSRRQRRERERVGQILLAEYAYWRDEQEGESPALTDVRIGAMGAISNVIAALVTGKAVPKDERSTTCHTSRP